MRFLNFVSVTNSKFHDMHITEVTDDNFTLGPGCRYNECRNLTGSFAGGNALTDKGDHNKWYDCVAEDCASDGWTPKCRYSEFYRCIARRNEGPGFGMFCRIDGSGNPVDLGEAIEGNKFYACQSYDNNAAGFSFNISNTSGEGGSITNNYIEAVCYNNASSGVRFRNKMPNSTVENNEINILCYGNRGLTQNGDPSSVAGGLGNDANSLYRVTGITGTIVSYDNIGADVNTDKAYDCSIKVYHPLGENLPILKKGDASNSLTVIDFNCSDSLNVWCVQEYCSIKSQTLLAAPGNLIANSDFSGQINLSWTYNTSDADGFRIERKSNGIYSVIATLGPNITAYTDTGLTEGTTYQFRIQAFNAAGNSEYSNEAFAKTDGTVGITSPLSSSDMNLRCTIYPNPFNSKTTFNYQLTEGTEVSLHIYNQYGQKICTLLNSEFQSAGNYSKEWNAADDKGFRVSTGIYYSVFHVVNKNGEFKDSCKLSFVK